MAASSWVLAPTDEALARSLSERLAISQITARVLAGRGIGSVDEAKAFLSPKLDQMHEPDSLADIDAAVERIIRGSSSTATTTRTASARRPS